MIDEVELENKYTFNSWQEFFTTLSACYSLIVITWCIDCSSSSTPLPIFKFVYKILFALQIKLETERKVVEELQSQTKF